MARPHLASGAKTPQMAAARKVTPNATSPGHTRPRSNRERSRQYMSSGACCARCIDSRNPYFVTARQRMQRGTRSSPSGSTPCPSNAQDHPRAQPVGCILRLDSTVALAILIEHICQFVHAYIPRASCRDGRLGSDQVDVDATQASGATILFRKAEHHHVFRADMCHPKRVHVGPAARVSAEECTDRETARADA